MAEAVNVRKNENMGLFAMSSPSSREEAEKIPRLNAVYPPTGKIHMK